MSDAELIEQTLQGNREAFSELVKRYRSFVFAQAYHRIRGFTEAEDITQEVFLKAYRQLAQLRHTAQFPSWLRSITLRICLNWLRHPCRLISIEDSDTTEIHALMIQDGPPTPEEEYERLHLREQMRDALASLPDPQQEALALYSFQEHSYREIATFLDVPVSTVKGRIYSARKKLQKEMFTMVSEYFGDHASSEAAIRRLISYGPHARQAGSLAEVLEGKGYSISTVTKRETLLKAVSASPPEALLLDVKDESDLSLAQELVTLAPDTAIIPVVCRPRQGAPPEESMISLKAWHRGTSLSSLMAPFSKDELLDAVKSGMREAQAKRRNPIVREAWIREHPDSLYAQYHFVCAKCGKVGKMPFCHEQPMELQPLPEDHLDKRYRDYCDILRAVGEKTGKPVPFPDKSEVPHLKEAAKKHYHHVCKVCGATWDIPDICCGEEMELSRREEKPASFMGPFNW